MRLPIRLRLTVAFAAVLAVVLVAAGFIVFTRVRSNADHTIDSELRARARTFLATPATQGPAAVDLLGLSDERFGQLLDRSGTVSLASKQVRGSRRLTNRSSHGLSTTKVRTRTEVRRVRMLVVHDGGRTLLLATALDDHDDALAELRTSLIWGAVATFVVACGLAWLLAAAALRPVERLRSAADAYSAADLSRRLDEPLTKDEIGRLAITLNSMLDRIQNSFERQRAFVDRASHELRTPLANLSLELELALRKDHSHAELHAALDSAADEAARLDALAANLLLLARTTDGVLPVVREPTDLCSLLRATAAAFASRAALADVALTVDCASVDPVDVDPMRARQAVTNLIDNAIRVTPAGGSVTVELEERTPEVVVRVTDSGPGFRQDLASTAFGPFVRGRDTGSTDGAGLGLAIVAAVAQAHGGSVGISTPATGQGAMVSFTLRREDEIA